MKIRYPSLELNWLSKKKWYSYPDIVYMKNNSYSGCYYHPQDVVVQLDDKEYELINGLIVINEGDDPATIAHEFRHHQQYLEGYDNKNPQTFNNEVSYRQAVKEYFTTCKFEWDCLLYELKHYPDEHNQNWYEITVNK